MCISPIHLKNQNAIRVHSMHAVPCGQCHECRLRRGSGWTFRLLQEQKKHISSHFITLTYADEYYPLHGSLQKRDLQLYFKRIRKLHKNKLSYYAVGEYGSITKRPHYHVIGFGFDQGISQNEWYFGSIRFDPVTPSSISYVTGYVNKPTWKDRPLHLNSEFSLMSKKLGADYLTPQMIKYHHENLENRCTLPGGVKIAMPRYYRDKIFEKTVEKDMVREKVIAHLDAQQDLKERLVGYDLLTHNENEAKIAAIQKFSHNSKYQRSKI